MAKAKLCAVEGCGNPHKAKGYCFKHYARVRRHGTPNPATAKTQPGEAFAWLRAHLGHENPDDCLVWPFATNRGGYGHMRLDGEYQRPHRVMCLMAHGMPSEGKSHVAHSCANRVCVNPHHLRWASKEDNEADKVMHGTSNRGSRHGMARLSEDDVRAMRTLKGAMSYSRIAAQFGVSYFTVWEILNGKRWAWLE